MPGEIPNPLFATHNSAGAEFQAYDRIEIVSTFGEPEAEYAAIRKSAALLDEPQRGFLEVGGKDRLPFLNNLLTNQTWDKSAKTGLRPGEGVYAYFLARNGRIVADMNVLERGDRTLLEMDARRVGPVREAFEKYVFTEQVTLADRTGALHQLALHGPGAAEVLRRVSGAAIPELPPLGSTAIRAFDTDLTVWRDDPTGAPGFFLVFDSQASDRVWAGFSKLFPSTELGRRPLRPAGWAAFNAARIEGGRPLFGIDFDDTILPHETGPLLSRAVSFTKGCYLGQEIVARMHARGQWARQIVGIKMAGDALPFAGAAIYDDNDNQVGGVTSSTVSPLLSGAAVALALVKKPFAAIGTALNLPAEGDVRKGSVVDLPFVKPEAFAHNPAS